MKNQRPLYKKPEILVLLTLLVACAWLVQPACAQKKTKTELAYQLGKKNKVKKKDATDSIYAQLDIKLDKSQFDTPKGILLILKDKKDKTMFSYGIGMDVISGNRHDTTGCVSIGKDEFIFHIDSIPPDNYLLQFRVLQENGDVYIVDKKQKI